MFGADDIDRNLSPFAGIYSNFTNVSRIHAHRCSLRFFQYLPPFPRRQIKGGLELASDTSTASGSKDILRSIIGNPLIGFYFIIFYSGNTDTKKEYSKSGIADCHTASLSQFFIIPVRSQLPSLHRPYEARSL